MRRMMSIVGIFLAAMAMSLVAVPAATADSGVRVVYNDGDGNSNEKCAGQWLSQDNTEPC